MVRWRVLVGVSTNLTSVADARWQVCLAGTAASPDETGSVLIEDLCAAGARLRGRHLPGPGKEVIVSSAGLDVTGYIAWARND
jgi:hypothetical protein